MAALTPHGAARLGERRDAHPILRAVSVTCTTAGRFHATFRDGSGGSVTAALWPRPAALVESGSLKAGDVVEILDALVTPSGDDDFFPCAPRAPFLLSRPVSLILTMTPGLPPPLPTSILALWVE